MKKKYIALVAALSLLAPLAACDKNAATDPATTGGETATVTETAVISGDEYFADGDFKLVTDETPNATIQLSGDEGVISDTTRGSSGREVTVTSKGIYRVSGTSSDVTIVVNDDNKSGNIYLVLDGVSMQNVSAPCIDIEACDKVVIQTVGENSLTYTNANGETTADGAIYAKDDLTINGSGVLNLSSSLHGVVCRDDLKITGGYVNVTADMIGLQAGDSLRVGGGVTTVNAGHDGAQIANDAGDSYFYMNDGALTIDAGYDGLDVTGSVMLANGTLAVTAGGGSDQSKNSDISQKGIKCDGSIAVSGGAADISAADDALHSSDAIAVSGGALTLSSSDDGMHADSALAISGGEIQVTKSYEGLEAETIAIAGGNVRVYASDDGVNAAGGSDSASTETTPWGGDSTGSLAVSGGYLYVNAEGDGLDSNGSISVSGGVVVVEGPSADNNGALDKGDGSGCVAEITGGTVLALGSAGMAVNFDSGTQCSALVSLSGSAGDTVAVNDGSDFSVTVSKDFACAVYSSPKLAQGNVYTITAGNNSADMDFSDGLYYSTVSGMGPGGMGGPGGNMGGPGGR